MLKRTLPILLALAVLLTACGPQGTPTMSSADVEGTAVSSAWTMVAMTQLAIPTATPLPPTETLTPTPLPTFTPLLPPTQAELLPTATKAAVGDCGQLNMGEAGPTVRVRIENNSGGTIEWLSLNLSTNAFGQCGALSYANIGINARQIVNLPRGFWTVYAGIKLKKGGSKSPAGSFELRVGDIDLLRLIVTEDSILLKP